MSAAPPVAEGPPRRLRRSRKDRWLGGVCGGIAEYFVLDPTLIRVLYVLVSVLSVVFPGAIVYILLWILIPARED
jgi:phage shock protein C